MELLTTFEKYCSLSLPLSTYLPELRFFQSGTVTIYAGKERRELAVHKAILSESGSPSLQKLAEPGWRESSEGCIDWTHTSTPTVERVLTWLYLRDYTSPDPIRREGSVRSEEADNIVDGQDPKVREDTQSVAGQYGEIEESNEAVEPLAEAEAAPEPPPEPDYSDVEDLELQNAILDSCSQRPLTPLGTCVGLPPVTTTYKTAAGLFEEEEFPIHSFSYREPLLAHVEVYSFGKYHFLRGLQDLALQRMIVTLRKIDCSVKYAREELGEIIEFAYDNIDATGDGEEPMRKLLSQFAAANYTSLLHGSFETLFGRGGEFTLDLARKLSRRLLAHGVSGRLVEDELEQRIQTLEVRVQERDETIKSLNVSLNDLREWGRGFNRRGSRGRYR
ncbi:hypothetical protein A1O1_07587 [Capronia coronata CBS 617.96]|uniref:BTB domain-containing protein n=1 Tax=Capronia coronata CBS 617.96 TaxID=1182541 RepID=W9XMT5_9EURO|nr:uncharacterized protein A1O1_07587 [Capronia coronata CBS 617.96]EXJ81523.1 hypothetical protein A1O1_07587 [Capronia coronata CBS 617.96]